MFNHQETVSVSKSPYLTSAGMAIQTEGPQLDLWSVGPQTPRSVRH
jgi:hypothetical protein